jgi:hypothetical protein
MNPSPSLTPDQAERLRELYRKCTEGLLLLPEDLVVNDGSDDVETPAPAPRQRRARQAPPPATTAATPGGAR